MRRVAYYPYATPQSLNALGDTGSSVSDFVVYLKMLAQGEAVLAQNYAALQEMVAMGGAPATLVHGYNTAAAQWNSIAAALEALHAILEGPTRAAPVPAPYIDIQVDRTITASSILYPDELRFGVATPPSVTLDGWWAVIPWGRAIVVAGLSYGYHRYTAQQMSDNEVRIAQIKAQAAAFHGALNQQTYLVNQAYNGVRSCMGSRYGQDPQLYQECLANATQNIIKIGAEGIPKPPDIGVRSGGLGFFGWVGVVALFAGLGVVGYALWRRRRDRFYDEDRYGRL